MKTALRILLGAAIAAAGLAGCDREAGTDTHAAADSVGEKVDSALERTRESLAAAGEKLKPGLEAAGEKLSEAADQVSITVRTGERSAVEHSTPAEPKETPPAR